MGLSPVVARASFVATRRCLACLVYPCTLSICLEEVLSRSVFDKDGDGEVSQDEVEEVLDVDKDGEIGESEQAFDQEHFKEHVYEHVKDSLQVGLCGGL